MYFVSTLWYVGNTFEYVESTLGNVGYVENTLRYVGSALVCIALLHVLQLLVFSCILAVLFGIFGVH